MPEKSDAELVRLARAGSPIYASEEVLQKAGIPVPAQVQNQLTDKDVLTSVDPNSAPPSSESLPEGKGADAIMQKLQMRLQPQNRVVSEEERQQDRQLLLDLLSGPR